MTYPQFWTVVFSLSLGTFLIRCSMIYLASRFTITSQTKEILSFIPSAVFPALVMPMVFFHDGQSSLLFQKERLVALLLATAVCYKSKNILLTIFSGLVLLYGLSRI